MNDIIKLILNIIIIAVMAIVLAFAGYSILGKSSTPKLNTVVNENGDTIIDSSSYNN